MYSPLYCFFSCSILRDILSKFRLQYLFCVPLQTEEKIINNIKQATSDKHDAFLAFYNSRITESEAATLKEQNETEFNNLKNALKSNLTDFRNVEELLNGLIDKKSLICNVNITFLKTFKAFRIVFRRLNTGGNVN